MESLRIKLRSAVEWNFAFPLGTLYRIVEMNLQYTYDHGTMIPKVGSPEEPWAVFNQKVSFSALQPASAMLQISAETRIEALKFCETPIRPELAD